MTNNYYKTKESVAEYIRLAKGVNGGELIEKLKEHLELQSTLLEIGTGPGEDWKILNKDFEILGSDNSNEFLAHLNTNNPNGRFVELDAISLDIDETFDGIFSNKVLHHLKDKELIATVKKQSDILNPHGIVCHSFWKGEGAETFKGLFVNYHTGEAIRKFFEPYFETIVIEDYAEFEEADSLLFIGKKKPHYSNT